MTPAAGLKVLHVVGARPNFMKIAPLLRRAEQESGWTNLLVHTGQHYDEDMSGALFRDLGIREPDHYLGVGSGTHAEQTGRVLIETERIIRQRTPDVVVVVGDVNSTLAAALAAAKLRVAVAHVEAGLRSGDRTMPEEINRILTDQIADVCLTPSPDADDNLRREGIAPERIHFVGNIMIDSLRHALPAARALNLTADLGLPTGGYILVTLHRPSNVDEAGQLSQILDALRELARDRPVVFPMHPRTRERVAAFGLDLGTIRVLDPLGYVDMLHLQEGAALVVTDSGGIQEETTVLGVPCLTLRDSTERPITVLMGTNRLVPDRSRERIISAVRETLAAPRTPRCPDGWDGHTADRIVEVLGRRPW